MADPLTALGAAAAIQQFLAAAGKVIQYCYGYVQKYRHAAATVARLAQELRALVTIFKAVSGIVGGQSSSSLQVLEHLGPLITAALTDAEGILKELPMPKMGRVQKLIWPFNDQRTTEMVDALTKKLSLIHTAVGYENFRLSEKTWAQAEALQKGFTAWEMKQNDLVKDERRSKILAWISFNHVWSLRFRDRHEDKRALRHPTTGIRVLVDKLYMRWKLEQADGTDSWLWAIGEAGSRKSTVMSVLVDDIMTDTVGKQTGVAVLYCRYESPHSIVQQTFVHIIGNMLSQLLRKCEDLPASLINIYQKISDSGEPSAHSLTDLFITTIESVSKAYLVIDGLDELAPSTRSELLGMLDRLNQKKVRILISSRPHSFELQSRLESANAITIAPTKAEIVDFLSDEIANNDRLQRKLDGDAGAAQALVDGIASKAGSSFTFAVAMLGTIKGGISKAQILKLLESASTPHDVFEGTMDRILQQDEKEDALNVLGWLTYSRVPLTLEQLRTALAISADGGVDNDRIPAEEIILEICAGLIQIQPSSNSIVLTHLTARDFLTKRPELTPEIFEPRLARDCIRYLMSTPFNQLCTTPEELSRREQENCLAIYAASYWAMHAYTGKEHGLEHLVLAFTLQTFASSALQLLPLGLSDSFAGLAGPSEYRLSLCQEQVPASYVCALFRLSKSQQLLARLEPELVGLGVSWGYQYSPLHLSVWLEDLDSAKILARESNNLSCKDKLGMTPVHHAATSSGRFEDPSYEILRVMLDSETAQQVDRDSIDRDGQTALHLAVIIGDVRTITFLLEHGYNPNFRDHSGSTPFYLFFVSYPLGQPTPDNAKAMQTMLKHGADPTVPNNEKKSPLAVALENGWNEYVILIREAANPTTNKLYVFSPEDLQLSEPLYQQNINERTARDKSQADDRQRLDIEKKQKALSTALKMVLLNNAARPT